MTDDLTRHIETLRQMEAEQAKYILPGISGALKARYEARQEALAAAILVMEERARDNVVPLRRSPAVRAVEHEGKVS